MMAVLPMETLLESPGGRDQEVKEWMTGCVGDLLFQHHQSSFLEPRQGTVLILS